MKKNPEGYDEWLIECSGRSVYANSGIFGLGPDPEGAPSEGYDGGVDDMGYFPTNPWTPAEKRELADEMIKRWDEWAKRPDETSS